MTRPRLLVLLLLLTLLTGCVGGGGVPLPIDRLTLIRDQFQEFDRLSLSDLESRLKTLQQEVAGLEQTKDRSLRAELNRKKLLIAYCWERRGDFTDAQRVYSEVAATEYGSIAWVRIGQVAEYAAADAQKQAADTAASAERRLEAQEILKLQQKKAVSALERTGNFPLNTRSLLRKPPVASLQPSTWETVAVRHYSYQRLDHYYRDRLSYRVFEFLVTISGGTDRNYSYVIAIFLIAILAKLITTPLSGAQFRSMQAMQRLQPQIKKLQEKYKDDKQQLARAQMELFKEAKVSPFTSCLPMLIQMPILIWVYYGIRHFVYRFEGVHFLYLHNLANPDVITIGGSLFPGPLLLLYGVSMYFSQKLIATPATTPEQEQQQKLMAYMMPLMLVFILKGLPAAFILYWFLQNLLMTGHQYLIMRSRKAPAAQAATPTPTPPRRLAGPPPEALDKLSQGTQRPKQKKKRK